MTQLAVGAFCSSVPSVERVTVAPVPEPSVRKAIQKVTRVCQCQDSNNDADEMHCVG
jgi:hypothetical protein